jgi:hypothetical protein
MSEAKLPNDIANEHAKGPKCSINFLQAWSVIKNKGVSLVFNSSNIVTGILESSSILIYSETCQKYLYMAR